MNNELPQLLQEIADVAGLDAAWALVKAKGGTSVWIPASMPPDHWLIGTVGLDAAEKLCRHFRFGTGDGGMQGRRLLIPMASAAQKKAAWQQVLDGELTLAETARTMNVHERTVWRKRAGKRRANHNDQGDLF